MLNNKIKKIIHGKVVSHKTDKTIVVLVERLKEHLKYRKKYRISKRYQVYDEKNKYKKGDIVDFIESRPRSKEKRWEVVPKLKRENKKEKNKRSK